MSTTTINGGDGRITFTQDPNSGQVILVQGDNVATFKLPSVRGNDGASLGAPSAHLSEAEQWLADLEAEQAALPDVEKFHLAGRDWFVLRGSSEDITQAGLWSARDASGTLNLLAEGTFTGMMAAFFFKFLVRSEKDKRRIFESYGAAYKQASSTHAKVIPANLQLFAEIVRLNPALMARDSDGQGTPEEDDAAPLGEAQVTTK